MISKSVSKEKVSAVEALFSYVVLPNQRNALLDDGDHYSLDDERVIGARECGL